MTVHVGDINLAELAAYVSDHLTKSGIDVVLSGGGCVSVYSDNRYESPVAYCWRMGTSLMPPARFNSPCSIQPGRGAVQVAVIWTGKGVFGGWERRPPDQEKSKSYNLVSSRQPGCFVGHSPVH
jgi:hypothetical protein